MARGPAKSFLRASIGVLYFGLLCWMPVWGVEFYTEKPSYVQTCSTNEPDFIKCTTESDQKIRQQLIKGIPEVTEIIGPIEPYRVGKIVYKQDNNEAATIRANLTNLTINGFAKMKTQEHIVNKKDFSWKTRVIVPKLRLEGQYKMKGKVLLVPLNGAGNMFTELENIDLVYHTKTRLYEKDGFTFFNLTQIRVEINLTGVKTRFDNIFNGNKEVEELANQLFNDNWRDFFTVMHPVIYETVENVLLKFLQIVYRLIPANFLIADIPTSQQLYSSKNTANQLQWDGHGN